MDAYLGQSAEEPPGASLIGLVGLFGFWFVPDEVPTIGDTSTIITHFETVGTGGSRLDVSGVEMWKEKVSRKGDS
jgi:hypothetical protein